MDENSATEVMLATLIRVSERWNRVSFSNLEH